MSMPKKRQGLVHDVLTEVVRTIPKDFLFFVKTHFIHSMLSLLPQLSIVTIEEFIGLAASFIQLHQNQNL